MNREKIKNTLTTEELYRRDELQNERVEKTKKRVAHAIRLLDNPVGCLIENRVITECAHDIARAVNLLEAGEQELRYACDWFEWNLDTCDNINAVCAKLGECLAILESDEEDDFDPSWAGAIATEGLAILGKVLATLIRWFDEEQDISEI